MQSEQRHTVGDAALMRELNASLVLNLIWQRGSISRVDIAKETRLSRSTVSSVVADLLKDGWVRESGPGESRGGRRPILLEFDYEARHIVGVVLSKDSMAVTIHNLRAEVVARTEDALSIRAKPRLLVQRVAERVRHTLGQSEIDWDKVIGIAVALPSPYDYVSGEVTSTEMMPGWRGVSFKAMLEEVLGKPAEVDNNANLGAIAEKWWGAGQGADNLVYVMFGVGIGSGLIIDGEIYRGRAGSAGEIGHLTIDTNGPRCRCGKKGCLEVLADARAILKEASSAVAFGEETSLREIRAERELRIVDVGMAAEAGDPLSRRVLQKAGRYLGLALADLVNLLNPDLVVLDAPGTGAVLLESAKEALHDHALPVARQTVEVIPADLGPNGVAIGAATMVLQRLLRRPSLAAQSLARAFSFEERGD